MRIAVSYGLFAPAALALLSLASPLAGVQQPAPRVGVLVMAHGGTPEWDRAVMDAVVPVKSLVPATLALGMADPRTLQAALDSLQQQGVEKVAVVRLFLSGESFLHDTQFLLGLRADAPAVTAMAAMSAARPGMSHDAHAMGPPKPLTRTVEILLEMRGLMQAPVTAGIVADRAQAVSTDRARESVIVIAHGMGDEGENQRVLDHMEPALDALHARGFADVQAATLREDWPEARAKAEAEIRAWVEARSARGNRVVVVPFRLFGFGTYAEVLKGLSYTPAESLLPHALVSDWIQESAASLFCTQRIATPLGACQ